MSLSTLLLRKYCRPWLGPKRKILEVRLYILGCESALTRFFRARSVTEEAEKEEKEEVLLIVEADSLESEIQ
jgi:hypothetical protein